MTSGAESGGAPLIDGSRFLSWNGLDIPTSPDGDKAANRSKIVVAVDDDGDDIALVGKIARFAGYTFFNLSNGAECVSLAMRMAPRLILLDVQMQGISGYETCRLLRNNPDLAHIPIAFLTARNTGEDVRRGITVGGNDFIIKPFDAAKLCERINFWVNRRISVRATRR